MAKRLQVFFTSLILILNITSAQLFNDSVNVKLARRSVDYIYNMQPDSAFLYLDSIEDRLPNHPIAPMLRAVNLLWQSMPYVTVDSTFEHFKEHLYEVAHKARQIDNGHQENSEAIFFEMAARGLLAEYYADADNYMKAVNEASKAYSLLKKAFERTDEIADFSFTVGIYNYFREAYPEKYAVYKPFVWIFRGGDKEKGIRQIEVAGEDALIVSVESYIYLAYIYLRYEFEPNKAQEYLRELTSAYPNNQYIRSKYLESMTVNRTAYSQITLDDIALIKEDGRPYYLLAAYSFEGLFYEWGDQQFDLAVTNYKRALSIGAQLTHRGEYLKSLCYLGLGRVYQQKEEYDLSRFYLEQAFEISETLDIREEAGQRLKIIGD